MTAYPWSGPRSRAARSSPSKWPFNASALMRSNTTPRGSRGTIEGVASLYIATRGEVVTDMATGLSPVIRLVEAAGQPVALVGGKAGTLGRLAAAGLPVPPG